MTSGNANVYKRFYQLKTDVLMLRIFEAFAESAPQLVFQIYVVILESDWPIHKVGIFLET